MMVFVTGGTGQVGSAIADHLANRGCHVITASRRQASTNRAAAHLSVNLGDGAALDRILGCVQPCEAIVHAAASLSHDLFDPTVSLTNCLGTQQIIKIAEAWRCRSIVYISSVPVIGRPQFHPITEEHPANPQSAYHASKLYGEQLVRLMENPKRSAVSLRLTSPAGPGTPANRILSVFVQRALQDQPLLLVGNGTRRQNYVDVRDVALAVEACLQKDVSGVYNVAARESISNYDLARICIEELKSSSTVGFSGTKDPDEGVLWDVSISKSERDLTYHPHCTIHDSIRAVADGYSYSRT